LTRLLDETSAKVILLVAPAGYGKTTLARQWLASRPHAWYVASEASADIAALGIGLSSAAEEVTSAVGHRFRQWLHARRGTEDPGLAADLLADDLMKWPTDAWLAIDDYHWLTPDAEQVIGQLTNLQSLRLLITARRRPLWSTSRGLLYGELFELGTSALAMRPDEASQVLADLKGPVAKDLIALAEGWPAIIGLASFAEKALPPKTGVLPPALHSYIADELFVSIDPAARTGLAELSLLSSPSVRLARSLLGPKSSLVVDEGRRVGFLTEEGDGVFAIHPLLRAFLRRKLRDLPATHQVAVLADVVNLLIDERSWQEAFEIVKEFEVLHLLDELIEGSLYDLLDDGLLETLSKFVEFGRASSIDSPLLDLAEAEFAFRTGFHERSQALAEEAGARLDQRPRLASKAFCRAGQCAYFADELEVAIDHFLRARELAEDITDERAAIWGLFLSAMEREDDAALTFLEEFEEISGAAVDDLARVQNGRLHLGMRLGTLSHGLSGAEAVADVIAEARDPAVRTSFWHGYAGALRAAASYGPALEASDKALEEISRFDLDFARAHVYVTRAAVYVGMAAYEEALAVLDEIGSIGRRNNDIFLQMNERMIRCRIHLLTDDAVRAVRVTDVHWPHLGSSGQSAEFLACRALALGMLPSATDDPFELLADAERRSRENEASSLCMCVRALLTLDGDTTSAAETITAGFQSGVAKGVLDPLVFGFRLDRRLSRLVNRTPRLRPALQELLVIVDDSGLEGEQDYPTDAPVGELESLTRREREVFALVADGKTNREIARTLFLTEGTVKVHVRHILGKLGARTRTEAAIYALKMQQREADWASRTPRPERPDSSARSRLRGRCDRFPPRSPESPRRQQPP
jgi:ATP/maltotriose-dependent transcriptional regulator MalT